jgi:hypothetical protein
MLVFGKLLYSQHGFKKMYSCTHQLELLVIFQITLHSIRRLPVLISGNLNDLRGTFVANWNDKHCMQDMYCSRRMASSGMLRRVALVRTDVLEELSTFFIRVTRIGELGTTLAVTSN